jgi:hypothetical protein
MSGSQNNFDAANYTAEKSFGMSKQPDTTISQTKLSF